MSGYTIHSTPVPSGGPLLLFLLNVMDEYGLSPSSDVNLTYHRLIEAFKYGFALRTLTGDPNCGECGSVRDEIVGTQINMTRYALEHNIFIQAEFVSSSESVWLGHCQAIEGGLTSRGYWLCTCRKWLYAKTNQYKIRPSLSIIYYIIIGFWMSQYYNKK